MRFVYKNLRIEMEQMHHYADEKNAQIVIASFSELFF